jgi:glycosyltransferase involved in cell wall biosynthesis
MNKKICIFTPYFYPEDFKINDISFELSKKGYLITVITPIPNYPHGKYFEGYSLFKRRKEIIDNITIIRLPVIPRGSGKKIMMILNYFSFLLTSYCFTFFFTFVHRFDLVFIHQLSPIFIAIPAAMMAKRQKIPLYSWVLDLWPESVQYAGGINNKIILHILERIVERIYKQCKKILIGSQGFKISIADKGEFSNKLIYFPNWAEDIDQTNNGKIDVSTIYPFSTFTDNDFVLLFAGNIGEAQNIDAMLRAASITRENFHIKWIFLGDGRRRSDLINKVNLSGLDGVVFFPGRFPLETMPLFMKKADLLLVSLKNENVFNLTIPQKVQFYMAQGKPILAMLNGDGAELIKKAGCGYCVPAGDYIQYAQIIKKTYLHKDTLFRLGENGKSYYDQHFKKMDRIEQLENIFSCL